MKGRGNEKYKGRKGGSKNKEEESRRKSNKKGIFEFREES